MSRNKFRLGQVVTTPGVETDYYHLNLGDYIARHATGDWGDLSETDKQANEEALLEGGRIFSSYLMPDGGKMWIITEADRSSTCLLLPEEY